MHRLILTFNLLVLYCLWYLDNLFRKCCQNDISTTKSLQGIQREKTTIYGKNCKRQLMRFSNITYVGCPKKILCSTYIYEIIDPKIQYSVLRPMMSNPKLFTPNPTQKETFLGNRKDYTRLWLETLTAIQEE